MNGKGNLASLFKETRSMAENILIHDKINFMNEIRE